MALRIEADKARFKKIVHGRVRENLKKYISQDNLIGRKGKDRVSIPINRIDTPRFRYGSKDQGGVGQGEGQPGDSLGGEPGKAGGKKAGEGEGDHVLEVDMTMDELADILQEELQLPNIENKGKKNIESVSKRYNGIRRVGSEGLRHFRRTFKEALKREISSGTYKPGGAVIPQKADKRYRTPSVTVQKAANAVIIYMMDVSGSMGDEQKHIVRTISFWMNAWIKKQYKGLETRYIIHDTVAKEVSEQDFFRTRESGGTAISSAYKKCVEIMNDYPFNDWNVYAFHFSDGDNWGGSDTDLSIKIIKEEILPNCNLFGYGQVDSPHGSGDFMKSLVSDSGDKDKIALASIPDRDGIMQAIKALLGKAK